MNRKEICRNFQRGSCSYGDRCRYLHATQQPQKSNPFGFGTQSTAQRTQTTQQQKPNPFGFGVQNNSQSKGAPNFGSSNQSSAKPFENIWSRTQESSTPSQKTDTKAQDHTCTDPNSCKAIFSQDFKSEAPQWKLTCYGHFKYLPCDIVGDVSFEELRAAAYEDGRRGLNVQAIVEKERNLLNTKLVEFDNLLRNPYVPRAPSSVGTPTTNSFPSFPAVQTNAQPQFPAAQSNAQLPFSNFQGVQSNAQPQFPSAQSNAQLPFSSFPAVQSNAQPQFPATQSNAQQPFSSFPSVQSNGQPQVSATQNNGQLPFSSFTKLEPSKSNIFGTGNQSPLTTSLSGFGQPSLSQTTSQTPNRFGFGVPGSGSPSTTFNNVSLPNGNKGFSFPSSQQFPGISNQSSSSFDADEADDCSDPSIWLKEEWDIGEIPDQAPPQKYCHLSVS